MSELDLLRHLAVPSAWFVLFLSAGCACLGLCYHLVSLYASFRFLGQPAPAGDPGLPVSILKPIRGVDPDAYENYASFCVQDYAHYEILFGVLDPADPAIKLVHRLQREHPEVAIRLVVSERRIGTNLKVCNLQNLLEEAKHDLLVISDGDMRVERQYLRSIAGYFRNPEVGLVTSPYCGAGVRSMPAALEALGMATDFFPGVAVASQLSPLGFALGSTLAFRRDTLWKIGGFKELADYLADDFQLGHRVARLGKKVVLSRYVVETVVPNAGFGPMFSRRLRWTRTARICQPLGFAGSIVTYSTFWTVACLAAAVPLGVSREILLAAVAIQQLVRTTTAGIIAFRVLKCRGLSPGWLALLPFSDLLNFCLWVGSWLGNTVVWRGDRYRLQLGGKMVRVAPEPAGGTGLVAGTAGGPNPPTGQQEV